MISCGAFRGRETDLRDAPRQLPELGTLDRKGIAALAGLAPLANDSGKQRGRRSSAGACRCALCAYMLTVAAIRAIPSSALSPTA